MSERYKPKTETRHNFLLDLCFFTCYDVVRMTFFWLCSKSGMLTKFGTQWQKRYVDFDGRELRYYSSSKVGLIYQILYLYPHYLISSRGIYLAPLLWYESKDISSGLIHCTVSCNLISSVNFQYKIGHSESCIVAYLLF